MVICDFAGWSSLVARQAHNLKVSGSNPDPATTLMCPKGHLGQSRRSNCVGGATLKAIEIIDGFFIWRGGFVERFPPKNLADLAIAHCSLKEKDTPKRHPWGVRRVFIRNPVTKVI